MPSDLEADTLNSLGEKLESFAEGLSEDERQALGGVIARAEAASQALVEGFELRSQQLNFGQVSAPKLERGMPSQLGNSLGGGIDQLATIHVSWGW